MLSLIDQCKGGMAMTARNVPKVMSGNKTNTRRIEAVLRKLDDVFDCVEKTVDPDGDTCFTFSYCDGDGGYRVQTEYPNHQVGDILYIKEALIPRHCPPDGEFAQYRSDSEFVKTNGITRRWQSDKQVAWRCSVLPARYMPKSAARTFIRITDVRCERIQDISYEDCIAEGLKPKNLTGYGDEPGVPSFPEADVFAYKNSLGEWDLTEHPQTAFAQLWNETNGRDAWERNDWVMCYTFELVEESK